MRLVGYIRVSRVNGREGENFISPDVQRERIQAHAVAHGHTIVRFLTDLDQTGGKMERPAFGQALEACQLGDADGIAVAKLDRFARTLPGALDCIAQLEAAGAVLVSVADAIDASTPNGRLMLHLLLTLAHWERDRIAAEWTTSRGRAIGRGVHIGSLTPYGYLKDDSGHLAPDPDTAPRVAAAFQQRVAGVPLATIARTLGKSPQATSYLLKNRTYLGEVRHGEHTQADAHPPLIDLAVWEAAQAAKGTASPRNDSGGMLLSGLVRCAQCRYVLAGRLSSGGRYSCRVCRAVSERSPGIEDIVTGRVLAKMAAPVLIGRKGSPEKMAADLKAAEAELAAYVHVMRATDPGFRDGYDQRAQAVDGARDALASTVMPVAAFDAFASEDIATRRAALTQALQAVFVEPGDGDLADRVHVVFAGDALVQLPARGNRGNALQPFRQLAA